MVGGLTEFGNRALTLTLWKKTPSTNTFSESLRYRIQSYLWTFLKRQCRSDINQTPRNTASLPRVYNRSNANNIRNHTSPSKMVSVIFQKWAWFFFYSLLKFDIINADVSFQERGHNFKTEEKLNSARHPLSKEVSWNVPADFQLNPLEDARKRTKNVHLHIKFYCIEKKTKNVSWDFYD